MDQCFEPITSPEQPAAQGRGDLVSGGSARYYARKCAMQRTKDGNRFQEE